MFVSYFLCLCKNVMSHVFCMCFVSLYSFFYCAFKSLQDSQVSQTVPPTTAVAASEVPSVMAAAEMLDVLLQGPEKKANSTVVNDKPKPKAKAKSNSKKKQLENSKKSKKVTKAKAKPGSKNCKASKGKSGAKDGKKSSNALHVPWKSIPKDVQKKFEQGCSRCRFRAFCTRSCRVKRGWRV